MMPGNSEPSLSIWFVCKPVTKLVTALALSANGLVLVIEAGTSLAISASKLLCVKRWPSAIGVTLIATGVLTCVMLEVTVLLLKLNSERPLTLSAKPSNTGLLLAVLVKFAKLAAGESVIGIESLLPTGVSNSH